MNATEIKNEMANLENKINSIIEKLNYSTELLYKLGQLSNTVTDSTECMITSEMLFQSGGYFVDNQTPSNGQLGNSGRVLCECDDDIHNIIKLIENDNKDYNQMCIEYTRRYQELHQILVTTK